MSSIINNNTIAISAIGGNSITFGPRIGLFRNRTKLGFRSFYHNSVVTNGGRGTVAFITSHEFGHSVDNSKYRSSQLMRGEPENYANNYAKSLFPYFSDMGINLNDIRVR